MFISTELSKLELCPSESPAEDPGSNPVLPRERPCGPGRSLGLSERPCEQSTYLAARITLATRTQEALSNSILQVSDIISHTLLFRHFFSTNQVPVGCPKNQKLPFALRPFKFLQRDRERGGEKLACNAASNFPNLSNGSRKQDSDDNATLMPAPEVCTADRQRGLAQSPLSKWKPIGTQQLISGAQARRDPLISL